MESEFSIQFKKFTNFFEETIDKYFNKSKFEQEIERIKEEEITQLNKQMEALLKEAGDESKAKISEINASIEKAKANAEKKLEELEESIQNAEGEVDKYIKETIESAKSDINYKKIVDEKLKSYMEEGKTNPEKGQSLEILYGKTKDILKEVSNDPAVMKAHAELLSNLDVPRAIFKTEGPMLTEIFIADGQVYILEREAKKEAEQFLYWFGDKQLKFDCVEEEWILTLSRGEEVLSEVKIKTESGRGDRFIRRGDEIFYSGGKKGNLHSISVVEDKLVSVHLGKQKRLSAVLRVGDVVFSGNEDGRITVHKTSGQEEMEIVQNMISDFVLTKEGVLAATSKGELLRLDPSESKELERKQIKEGRVVLCEDHYIALGDGNIVAETLEGGSIESFASNVKFLDTAAIVEKNDTFIVLKTGEMLIVWDIEAKKVKLNECSNDKHCLLYQYQA